LTRVVLVVLSGLLAATPSQTTQTPPTLTFRGGINLVAVTVVVKNPQGQPVSGLARDDFELYDSGERRAIAEFRSDDVPVSLALLIDLSGSMVIPPKLAAAREAAHHLVSWLNRGTDQVALFGFDTRLRELQPFTTDPAGVIDCLDRVTPYGSTSLFDSVAATAQALVAHSGSRRAVVALTDGGDNASALDPRDAAGIASGIDVPVYVLTVGRMQASLDALTQSTGGQVFVANGTSQASLAARQIVDDLRHQYLLAFEPGARPGWHALSVRLRDKNLVARSRSGYVAGPRGGA
jgi:Ca-activated chloride channel family protein